MTHLRLGLRTHTYTAGGSFCRCLFCWWKAQGGPREMPRMWARIATLRPWHNAEIGNCLKHVQSDSVLTLSFFSLVFWVKTFFIKENLKITKDFLSLPNPQNPWKRQRKHQNNPGNPSLQIYQGNPKNQGKEGLGRWAETRFLKTDARVETRVSKTLGCRNGFWTSFKQW